MKKSETIHFIFTGGTIDSHFEGNLDTIRPNRHSVIPEYLKQLKLYQNLKFTEICMKDSRQLTMNDIKKINAAVQKSPSKKIIITHGTYTMADTARYLKNNLNRSDQKIIITGSMVPLKGFDFTDAPFCLGYAIAMVDTVDRGIYVCMNGRVFSPDEVAKSINEGRFYSIFKERVIK